MFRLKYVSLIIAVLLHFFFATFAFAQENGLRFLILPVEEVDIMFRQFLPVKHYLEKTLETKIELTVARNYEAALAEIGQGKADLAYLDPSAYCEAQFLYQVVPLVRTVKHKKAVYRSVLVTREDAPIQKIIEVKGKRLALGNIHSSSSFLMPLAMLKEIGLSLHDFQKVGYLQEEDRVALAVLVGDYDVGALSEEVAQKYIPYGLRIIKSSEAIPQFTICASAKLKPALRNKIKAALLRYQDKNYPNLYFSPTNDRDYDIVRIMLKNLTGQNYLIYPPGVVKIALLPLYSALTLYEMFSPLLPIFQLKRALSLDWLYQKTLRNLSKL